MEQKKALDASSQLKETKALYHEATATVAEQKALIEKQTDDIAQLMEKEKSHLRRVTSLNARLKNLGQLLTEVQSELKVEKSKPKAGDAQEQLAKARQEIEQLEENARIRELNLEFYFNDNRRLKALLAQQSAN